MTQSAVRKALLKQRRALSPRERQTASDNLATRVCNTAPFRYSRRLAFYIANDGEIDPAMCLDIADACGKQCFLPVIHPLKFNRLYFARYRRGDALQINRYGIPEPDLGRALLIPAWSLDIIFLPLAAFDSQCHRIGMGGGYYDRTLAFKRRTSRASPLLIGLAYQFQQVDTIIPHAWDIPLNAVITDGDIFISPPRAKLNH